MEKSEAAVWYGLCLQRALHLGVRQAQCVAVGSLARPADGRDAASAGRCAVVRCTERELKRPDFAQFTRRVLAFAAVIAACSISYWRGRRLCAEGTDVHAAITKSVLAFNVL